MLDEPFSSLDTSVRRSLQAAVRRIQRETGVTTVLVTHDLEEALSMADRVALLLDGQIVALGTPQQVYTRPSTLAAARFLGVTTFVAGTLHGCQLTTAAGVWVLDPASDSMPATQPRSVTVAIRPEQITLHATRPADLPNCVLGTCKSRAIAAT